MLASIEQRIAQELNIQTQQVIATITLLDDGATVPFIARYRKELTGSLDDTQLRTLYERLAYLRELEDRRNTIINSIKEQGKLDQSLQHALLTAETKQRLEDLYLPYKPKRRTKAQIAKEAGLEPLADDLLNNPLLIPEQQAQQYIQTEGEFTTSKEVLNGAKQILMERFAEDPELIDKVRQYLLQQGLLSSKLIESMEQQGAKYLDWFDFSESLATLPSHRILALLRGRSEGILKLAVILPEQEDHAQHPCEQIIARHLAFHHAGRPADDWLSETIRWTWQVKLSLHLELEIISNLRIRAEDDAIHVFAGNLKELLLAAPAGTQVTMGLDPGIRTGVKVAVVDQTSKLLETATIYPFEPKRDIEGALHTLSKLISQHKVALIAIGNGTASRETNHLVQLLLKQDPKLTTTSVTVSEAGASVYSASEFASKEFPDVDVSLRGAISIARRLQDPLAELVKIEPKAIGVGQYQHDLNQIKLARSLDGVVEDCVNGVGVDLNTASIPLLSRISGLNKSLAENIVEFRDRHGSFKNRRQLLEVKRFGPKAFEQSAGFLRLSQGDNPLDALSVHPESYSVVKQILKSTGLDVPQLMGNKQALSQINPAQFTNEKFGIPTILDILNELEKPGRDPRPEFRIAKFNPNINTPADLKPGQVLEGVISNVTHFGAFVDIGVHQDGLVHISALSHHFVKDPLSVVKTGQIVMVKVLEVDLERKRIALTMRLEDSIVESSAPRKAVSPKRNTHSKPKHSTDIPTNNAMANALQRAIKHRQ